VLVLVLVLVQVHGAVGFGGGVPCAQRAARQATQKMTALRAVTC